MFFYFFVQYINQRVGIPILNALWLHWSAFPGSGFEVSALASLGVQGDAVGPQTFFMTGSSIPGQGMRNDVQWLLYLRHLA